MQGYCWRDVISHVDYLLMQGRSAWWKHCCPTFANCWRTTHDTHLSQCHNWTCPHARLCMMCRWVHATQSLSSALLHTRRTTTTPHLSFVAALESSFPFANTCSRSLPLLTGLAVVYTEVSFPMAPVVYNDLCFHSFDPQPRRPLLSLPKRIMKTFGSAFRFGL